jgi:RNA:NAD 2'-phosphotransferase (TPT1/KptA family)
MKSVPKSLPKDSSLRETQGTSSGSNPASSSFLRASTLRGSVVEVFADLDWDKNTAFGQLWERTNEMRRLSKINANMVSFVHVPGDLNTRGYPVINENRLRDDDQLMNQISKNKVSDLEVENMFMTLFEPKKLTALFHWSTRSDWNRLWSDDGFITGVGKYLSYACRHSTKCLCDPHGYTDLRVILENKDGNRLNLAFLLLCVLFNPKNRFQITAVFTGSTISKDMQPADMLKKIKLYIRGTQGHSKENADAAFIMQPVDKTTVRNNEDFNQRITKNFVIHCTTERSAYAIFHSGKLIAGGPQNKRNDIHFASAKKSGEDLPTSGALWKKPIYCFFDASRFLEDNQALYISVNNVIVSKTDVPIRYIHMVHSVHRRTFSPHHADRALVSAQIRKFLDTAFMGRQLATEMERVPWRKKPRVNEAEEEKEQEAEEEQEQEAEEEEEFKEEQPEAEEEAEVKEKQPKKSATIIRHEVLARYHAAMARSSHTSCSVGKASCNVGKAG